MTCLSPWPISGGESVALVFQGLAGLLQSTGQTLSRGKQLEGGTLGPGRTEYP